MNECRLLKKDKARRGERIAYYVKQLPWLQHKARDIFSLSVDKIRRFCGQKAGFGHVTKGMDSRTLEILTESLFDKGRHFLVN